MNAKVPFKYSRKVLTVDNNKIEFSIKPGKHGTSTLSLVQSRGWDYENSWKKVNINSEIHHFLCQTEFDPGFEPVFPFSWALALSYYIYFHCSYMYNYYYYFEPCTWLWQGTVFTASICTTTIITSNLARGYHKELLVWVSAFHTQI
jgi:hypothetical protein